MYAIIRDGGKQYTLAPNQTINLEKKDLEAGARITFSEVLYFRNEEDIRVGAPLLANVKVEGVVQEYLKGPKVTSFKYRRREDSRWKKGHRQGYTRVRISKITTE